MKIPVRLATLFAVTLMPVASFHASTVDARPTLSRPCPLTLPQQISTGTLSNGQTSTVIKWSLTCTGPFTASARGGKLILQSKDGAGWASVGRGSSITIPALGPGSYRLIVENTGQIRVNYKVRFRYAFG